MPLDPYNNNAEVHSRVLNVFQELSCFGNVLHEILFKHGIDIDNHEEWFPLQHWLDIYEDICNTFGSATMFFIGLNLIEATEWPPHIDSLEDALLSINDAYKMNHRGDADIGSYKTEKINDNKYIVTCTNPYPSSFDLGLIKGVSNKFSPHPENAFVMYDINKPTRMNGDEACHYIVIPSKTDNNGHAEKWVNSEVALIHAVLKETSDVMNAMSSELESSYLKTESLNKQLEETNHHLRQLTTIDELTKIANRRLFNEHFQREWLASKRSSTNLALILCDIDDFKLINDEYGHPVGDDCIRYIADLLMSSVKRPRELVSRIGGEEFAIILPDTNIDAAMEIAKRMIVRLSSQEYKSVVPKLSSAVTLSFGVSVSHSTITSTKEFFKNSDDALYDAKASGKNCVKLKKHT